MIIFKRVGCVNPYEKQCESDEEVDTVDAAKSAVEKFKAGETYEDGEEFAVLSTGADRIFTFKASMKLT